MYSWFSRTKHDGRGTCRTGRWRFFWCQVMLFFSSMSIHFKVICVIITVSKCLFLSLLVEMPKRLVQCKVILDFEQPSFKEFGRTTPRELLNHFAELINELGDFRGGHIAIGPWHRIQINDIAVVVVVMIPMENQSRSKRINNLVTRFIHPLEWQGQGKSDKVQDEKGDCQTTESRNQDDPDQFVDFFFEVLVKILHDISDLRFQECHHHEELWNKGRVVRFGGCRDGIDCCNAISTLVNAMLSRRLSSLPRLIPFCLHLLKCLPIHTDFEFRDVCQCTLNDIGGLIPGICCHDGSIVPTYQCKTTTVDKLYIPKDFGESCN
mmetsp:Transcript_4180/g.9451  ORF Transcript_4180/g.9451 Transcript_4180/m.9451 type:complete len:322 (-) Transcript_4180:460-1425(-)